VTATFEKLDHGEEDNPTTQYRSRVLEWPLSSKDIQEVLMTIEKHKARLNLALTADNTPASIGADADKLIVKPKYEKRTAKRIAHLPRKKVRPFAAADIL
jgi:hypothetical protein